MTKKAKGVLDLEGDGKVRRLAVVPAKVSKSSRATAAKAEEGGTQVAKKKKPKIAPATNKTVVIEIKGKIAFFSCGYSAGSTNL